MPPRARRGARGTGRSGLPHLAAAEPPRSRERSAPCPTGARAPICPSRTAAGHPECPTSASGNASRREAYTASSGADGRSSLSLTYRVAGIRSDDLRELPGFVHEQLEDQRGTDRRVAPRCISARITPPFPSPPTGAFSVLQSHNTQICEIENAPVGGEGNGGVILTEMHLGAGRTGWCGDNSPAASRGKKAALADSGVVSALFDRERQARPAFSPA